MSRIEGDTHSNNPANPGYDPGTTSWLGETFTFNGGSSTFLTIDDDDPLFEDNYVETGGAQTLVNNVSINGTTYFAGSVIENEFSMLDASGAEVWVVRINGVNVGFTYATGDEPTAGETFTGTVGRDGNAVESDDGFASAEHYNVLVCFTPGALIETPGGPRPVEALEVGDLVVTVDRGPMPIRWISRRRVVFRNGLEDAKPVEIKAGAFAPGLPDRDLVVSPQHRILLRDRRTPRGTEVLVAAKALTRQPRVRSMLGKKRVEYIHFAFDRHEVVIANGVHTESCYLGPVVLDDMPLRDRAQIQSVFPSIRFDPGRGFGPTARPMIKVGPARELLKSAHLVYDSVLARSGGQGVADRALGAASERV